MRHGSRAVTGVFVLVAVALPSCALTVPTTAPSVVRVEVDASKPGSPLNEGLVGVNGPGPVGAATAMKNLGLDWVRVDGNLGASYNCATGAWDPTHLDAQIAGVRAESGTPEVDVGGTPACLQPNPPPPPGLGAGNDPPDVGPANQAAWDALVYQMALHEITAEGVTIFEVENEPDWVYFNGTMAQYFQVYADTAASLEKAATAAGTPILVGGPVLANVLDTMDTAWLDPFLSYVDANKLPLDFLSWHVYPTDPYAGPSPGLGAICFGNPPGPNGNPCYYNRGLNVDLYGSETAQARASLAVHPDLHPLLVIDEWNLNGEYDARQDGPYGAAFATAAMASAAQAGVDRMCFWFTADDTAGTLGNWGMLSADMTPKPVYFSFLFWHEMAGDVLPTSVVPGQDVTNPYGAVLSLATRSANGAVSVMLDNFQAYDWSGTYGTSDPTPTDRTAVVDVTGMKPGTTYAWSRTAVDANHAGAVVATRTVTNSAGAAQLRFTLPGDSVSLVSFVPESP